MKDGRAAGPGPSPSRRTTTVEARSTLDAEHEKTIRMRYGFALPEHIPLPQKGEGRPDVAAELQAMELRAFEMSGRYREMALEAGVDLDAEGAEEQLAVKRKIIERLKGQSSD
ncbi:MAG: hypothetical protein AAF449_18895 [Myxococcota bacterium]